MFTLFGNKEVKAVQEWCKGYSQSSAITEQVLEYVKQGHSAGQAIELGRTLNHALCQQVQQQNDALWRERGERIDKR